MTWVILALCDAGVFFAAGWAYHSRLCSRDPLCPKDQARFMHSWQVQLLKESKARVDAAPVADYDDVETQPITPKK